MSERLRHEYLLRSGRIVTLPRVLWQRLPKARRRKVVR